MRFLCSLLAMLIALCEAHGTERSQAPEFQPDAMKKLLKPLGPDKFQIGQVTLDKKRREVSFPAKVNLRDVLIEYAIVGKMGKRHESLLATDVLPTHIHIAMLLLGTKNMRPKSEERRLPPGQPIDILMEWSHEGKKKTGRIEDWIIIEKDRRPISQGMWVYSGARIDNGYFTANTDESIVAIILDIDALANNPRIGNENDEIWFPNEPLIPKVGTDVRVTFKLLNHYTVSPPSEAQAKP